MSEGSINSSHPVSMKRAEAKYTNDTLLLMTLETPKIKSLVESVTFDHNKKIAYINLHTSQPWSFWEQLIPLISNPKVWSCRESPEQFATRHSFQMIVFKLSPVKKSVGDYLIKKSKTFPFNLAENVDQEFIAPTVENISHEQLCSGQQHDFLLEEDHNKFEDIKTGDQNETKNTGLWDRLKTFFSVKTKKKEKVSFPRCKKFGRKLDLSFIEGTQNKIADSKQEDDIRKFRQRTRNIADNWIQAMNDGCSLEHLTKKMVEIHGVKWTCDFLRANPQLKKFHSNLNSIQRCQRISQQKIGEERYKIY